MVSRVFRIPFEGGVAPENGILNMRHRVRIETSSQTFLNMVEIKRVICLRLAVCSFLSSRKPLCLKRSVITCLGSNTSRFGLTEEN